MVLVALHLPIAGTVLFLVPFLSLRRNARRQSKFPPGNMGWPLIGETFSFVKPYPVNSMGAFMEHSISRFARIFVTNLFGKLMIVSADLAKPFHSEERHEIVRAWLVSCFR